MRLKENFANSAALQRLGIEETSSSDRAELAQRLEENTAVQLAYLEAKGKTVEPAYKTERDQFDSLGNDTLEKVIEHIGADEIKAAFEGGDFDQLDQLADKRRTHWKKSILTDSWRARTGVGKCALTR